MNLEKEKYAYTYPDIRFMPSQLSQPTTNFVKIVENGESDESQHYHRLLVHMCRSRHFLEQMSLLYWEYRHIGVHYVLGVREKQLNTSQNKET